MESGVSGSGSESGTSMSKTMKSVSERSEDRELIPLVEGLTGEPESNPVLELSIESKVSSATECLSQKHVDLLSGMCDNDHVETPAKEVMSPSPMEGAGSQNHRELDKANKR